MEANGWYISKDPSKIKEMEKMSQFFKLIYSAKLQEEGEDFF